MRFCTRMNGLKRIYLWSDEKEINNSHTHLFAVCFQITVLVVQMAGAPCIILTRPETARNGRLGLRCMEIWE